MQALLYIWPQINKDERFAVLTTNVLQRIFHVNCGDGTGTAFAIDYDSRQYLVTAAHILDGFEQTGIQIYHEQQWKNLNCKVVGRGNYIAGQDNGEPDVAVLATNRQIAPVHPMPASAAHIVLGQTIYFAGFPYGRMQNVQRELNRDFPLPLVKSGILSSVGFGDGVLLLDGHNNPGFSGGPVVFVPNGQQPNRDTQFNVAGIVSAYPAPSEPVYNAEGKEIGYIRNNPGIVIAYSIQRAIEYIEANPIGFELPQTEVRKT